MAKRIQENDEMVFRPWGSGWGLPSINLESLQVLAYIKFSGAPITILKCENPWRSPKGIIPFFQCNSTNPTQYLYKPTEIAAFLRKKNYSCDFGLSPKQTAEVIAYTKFITEALDPAMKYYCYVDDGNYNSLIRPCYAKRLPWFYKFWYPDRRLKSEAKLLLSVFQNGFESAEGLVAINARNCINVLSDKLGKHEFFMYPNSPTALDALVFSYLAMFMKVPLTNCPIKEFIRLTPNLENYVNRILHRYFPNTKGDAITSTSTTYGPDGNPTKSDDDNPYPLAQKIFTIAIGIGIMFGFAYMNGMVDVSKFFESSRQDDEAETDDQDGLIWE